MLPLGGYVGLVSFFGCAVGAEAFTRPINNYLRSPVTPVLHYSQKSGVCVAAPGRSDVLFVDRGGHFSQITPAIIVSYSIEVVNF